MTTSDAPPGPPPYITTSSSPPNATRHEDYYFEDGNLVIQVSGILFRIWDGSFRRHAKAFPVAPILLLDDNKVLEGSDDAHPLVLEGVDPADFERLLWIVYPPVLGQCKATTTRDWIAILDLATRWKFNDIRELAIRELGAFDMDAATKIEVLHKYHIPHQWGYNAYITLCSRQHALDVIEGRQLGIETTVKVAFARETLDKYGRKKPDEVKKVVSEVFEIKE